MSKICDVCIVGSGAAGGKTLGQLLQQKKIIVAPTTQHVTHPWLAKLWKRSGADFVYIEYEHSFWGLCESRPGGWCEQGSGSREGCQQSRRNVGAQRRGSAILDEKRRFVF